MIKGNNYDADNFKINYIKILHTMKPVLPHLVSECLNNLGEKETFIWPKIEKKYLKEDTTNIVIQINGKKRDLIKCKYNISEKDLIEIIDDKVELKKYFKDKKIQKKIYVKNKIINFILK